MLILNFINNIYFFSIICKIFKVIKSENKMKTLEDYSSDFKYIDGIEALYCIDINTKKIQSEIIEPSHDKSYMIDSIKSLSSYLKRAEFDMIYIESQYNIFFKNIVNDHLILVLVVDKEHAIGSIFNILKKL